MDKIVIVGETVDDLDERTTEFMKAVRSCAWRMLVVTALCSRYQIRYH